MFNSLQKQLHIVQQGTSSQLSGPTVSLVPGHPTKDPTSRTAMDPCGHMSHGQ